MKKTYSKILSVVLALCCFLPVICLIGCTDKNKPRVLNETERAVVGDWGNSPNSTVKSRTFFDNGDYQEYFDVDGELVPGAKKPLKFKSGTRYTDEEYGVYTEILRVHSDGTSERVGYFYDAYPDMISVYVLNSTSHTPEWVIEISGGYFRIG